MVIVKAILKHYTRIFIDDGLVKGRHSRASGNPESANLSKRLDSRLHGNDRKADMRTFYQIIIDESLFSNANPIAFLDSSNEDIDHGLRVFFYIIVYPQIINRLILIFLS